MKLTIICISFKLKVYKIYFIRIQDVKDNIEYIEVTQFCTRNCHIKGITISLQIERYIE